MSANETDWFATQLLAWFDVAGRKDLPWQQDISPYRVWVSEIMLQQTQVATVIDYYQRFMDRFPDVHALARADLDEVLHFWTGLGYYARARNLHKTAQTVVRDYDGEFPDDAENLEALPGIGRSTAGAIRAIAQQAHAAILDGNVKRVLCRFHAVAGYPGATAVNKALWSLAEAHTPASRTADYTQAIMDLGATVCTRRNPACTACPVQTACAAHAEGKVDLYPERKPKKAKPERTARFFVVTLADGSVLLEQQPMDGLWGGLWNPPQRDSATTPAEFLQELGLRAEDLSRQHIAPTFRHTFTHFHLHIEPVYLVLEHSPAVLADDASQRWLHPDEVRGGNQRLGLSAPAVRLLASLDTSLRL